jgi:septal ring factor EnvC (AmiA/AmiB activator)
VHSRSSGDGPKPPRPGIGRILAALAAVFLLGGVLRAGQGNDLAKRAAERLAALQHESEALARQERTILNELRQLELDRQIKATTLAEVERQAGDVQARLAEAEDRAALLAQQSETERPDVEARLVQLYKLGRVGYWRLLLDVDSLREMGRAYRTASALAHLDRERIEQHRKTVEALNRERTALRQRAAELERLRGDAVAARAAVDRAVAAHNALVKSIDARRDLNAQLTGELQEARDRLQSEVTRMQLGATGAVGLPIRPFQGALPWPADGVPMRRVTRGGVATTRNGVELSLPEGQPVKAVHEGTVAFADQFTGYGRLVIIDHGDSAFSLYGYLSDLNVRRGQTVKPGTTVGLSGRNPAGNPSLYFELRIDGRAVDPLQWLKRP